MRAFLFLLLCGLGSLHAAAPVVSNISAAQLPNSRLVDITYDVAADSPKVKVSLKVSNNGGSTFTVPATTLSGAIGAAVTTGKAKKITWDAGKDWSGQYSTQMRFKVIADDGNSAPTISNIADRTITAESNTGAVAFTIGDAQKAAALLSISGRSSNTTLVPNTNIVFGGSGANRTVRVTPASGQSGTTIITVTVSDGSLTRSDTFVLTVLDFVLIPKGKFTMGNISGDADIKDAAPRQVDVEPFYIGKYEVTKAQWDKVLEWGISKGYTDLRQGGGKDKNHPVHSISWYETVKWCNARSEMDGLVPVYYIGRHSNNYYRTGFENSINVNKLANGYRLPTEAEWEKAARVGLSNKRFPWGDTISHDQANYRSDQSLWYDLSGQKNTHHPKYNISDTPYTSPVEDFANDKNVYGLHQIVGNVREWCWDWYDATNKRAIRGGGWDGSAELCRVARRDSLTPNLYNIHVGFRLVRSLAP